ncbi:MAG: macro domain-containing protein [Clostridia bacterium]|nr:macro domain-containing protein [Clostridia bacterium]
MPFQIIRNDITKVKADAIVNTANPEPAIGRGTDSAIYKAAGERRLLAERQKLGNIAPGAAAYTRAFRLSAKYIIHTVGPAWNGGDQGEREILRACYTNSLALAAELKCGSIAFPLIATGVYGFPKDEALRIALDEINRFLLSHDMNVILVVLDRGSFELSARLSGDIQEYVDNHSAAALCDAEYGVKIPAPAAERSKNTVDYSLARRMKAAAMRPLEPAEEDFDAAEELASAADQEMMCCAEAMPAAGGAPPAANAAPAAVAAAPAAPAAAPAGSMSCKSLDEVVKSSADTFQERLLHLIDESGMTDVTVYKKANIDRKVFSRIRCKRDYKPKKKTAVAFAIALELDMPTMLDLLARAEIAFSPSSKFDLIITYFVTNKKYDIYEINSALFKYGQPLLGE